MKRALSRAETDILSRAICEFHSHDLWTKLFIDAELDAFDVAEGPRWHRIYEVLIGAQEEEGGYEPVRRLLSGASQLVGFEAGEEGLARFRDTVAPLISKLGIEVSHTGEVIEVAMTEEVSPVTRRRLLRVFDTVDWKGEVGEVELLSRVYDLETLPSTDSRFKNAAEDIRCHRIWNEDWEPNWVFEDSRFGLGKMKQLLTFLENVVHPEVRDDGATIVERLNGFLEHDGWCLRESGRMSGIPIFKACRCDLPSRTKFEELQEGSVVDGRYRVLEFMTEGGYGRIYRVFDATDKVNRVLKECDPDSSGEDRHRFVREVEAMRSIKHPHVMQILDSGTFKDAPYYIMPLAQGGDLADAFPERSGNTTKEALEAFVSICRGVEAIHKSGNLHRDLKPENILRLDGRWVVSDLGLAGRHVHSGNTTRLTASREILGTDAYLAPEVRAGDSATVHSDVYALGLILAFLLNGRPTLYDLRDSLSAALKDIIRHATQTERESRYPSVSALLLDVQDYLSSLTKQGDTAEALAIRAGESELSSDELRRFALLFADLDASERIRVFRIIPRAKLAVLVTTDEEAFARLLESYRRALDKAVHVEKFEYAETVAKQVRSFINQSGTDVRVTAFRCLLTAAVDLGRYVALDAAIHLLEEAETPDLAQALLAERQRTKRLSLHGKPKSMVPDIASVWTMITDAKD